MPPKFYFFKVTGVLTNEKDNDEFSIFIKAMDDNHAVMLVREHLRNHAPAFLVARWARVGAWVASVTSSTKSNRYWKIHFSIPYWYRYILLVLVTVFAFRINALGKWIGLMEIMKN